MPDGFIARALVDLSPEANLVREVLDVRRGLARHRPVVGTLEHVKVGHEAVPAGREVQTALARPGLRWSIERDEDARQAGEEDLDGFGAGAADGEVGDAASCLRIDDGVPNTRDADWSVAGYFVFC